MLEHRGLCSLLLFLLACVRQSYGGDVEELVTCLTSNGAHNFTTSEDASFLHIIDKTVQNLRFVNAALGKPVAVIHPGKKQEVAAAVRCCRQGGWAIRLRGGGHSFEGTSSSAESPFVLIDMVNLNRITVDVETETAWVEGGATLGQIYHDVSNASKSLAFPGGFCPTVGAGGHLSGGGYGGLSRKFGLSADNVVDALLVDAKGRILDRKSMGEDVFWALRGGGGGTFGAVAAWKIKLLKVPETVTAFRVARMGSVKQMAEIWYKWQFVAPHLEDEFHLQVAVFPGGEDFIILGFLGQYIGPKAAALEIITKAFPELAISDQECNTVNWAEAVVLLRGDPNVTEYAHLPHRHSYERVFEKMKSDFVRAPLPKTVTEEALEMLTKQRNPVGWLLLDPLGGFFGRVESDFTPFPHRAGNLYCIEYILQWKEAGNELSAEYLDWMRRLHDFMTPHVAKDPRAAYVNNIDFDLGVIDWTNSSTRGEQAVVMGRVYGEKYFLGNYERLVRAKMLIDPENVFRHPQSIPPFKLADQDVFAAEDQPPNAGVEMF